MSDLEQSPVPPVAEISEPGSGPRVAPAEPEGAPPAPSEPPSDREPASETGTKKRGSIRPAPAGWRSSEGRLRPAPMVVVYSGDSDRPAPNWETEQHSPRGPSVRGLRAEETGPFLPVQGFYRKTLPSGLFDALAAESQEAPPQPESEQRSVALDPALTTELADAERPAPSELTSSPTPARTEPELEQRSVLIAPEPPVAAEPERVSSDLQSSEPSELSRADRAAAITARALRSPSQAPPNPASAGDASADARAQPTVRMPRVQPGARRLSSVPAAPTEASVNAAKALAARGMRVSGRPPPEETRLPGVPRSLVIGLWAVAVGLALFLIQRARVRSASEHAGPSAAQVEASREPSLAPQSFSAVSREPQSDSPPAFVEPKAEPSAPPSAEPSAPPSAAVVAQAPNPEPAQSAQAEPLPPAESAAAAEAPSATKASSNGIRTVKLEVMPADSKVFVRGLMRKGPPFLFEIKPGSRVIVEVVRPGYVARRVVLDGSKLDFAVGLLRRTQKARPRAETPNSTAGSEPAEERPAVVQSGL